MRNRIRKRRLIIASPSQRLPITHDHILRSHRTQRIHLQSTRLPIHAKHLALAVLRAIRRRARGVIIIEETVQTCTVDHGVAGVQQTETKRVAVAG